jgi:hypothetical protein
VHWDTGRAQSSRKGPVSEEAHHLDLKPRPIDSGQHVEEASARTAVEGVDDLNDARHPVSRWPSAAARDDPQDLRGQS